MVAANKKGKAAKMESDPEKDAIEKEEVPLNSSNIKEEVNDDDVEDEDEYEEDEEEDDNEEEDDEDEYEEEEEEEYDEEEEEPEEEMLNEDGTAVAVVNNEGTEIVEEKAVGQKDAKKPEEPELDKKSGESSKSKENAIKKDLKKAEEPESHKKSGETVKSNKNTVKKATKKAEEPESGKKLGETSKSKENAVKKDTKKAEEPESDKKSGRETLKNKENAARKAKEAESDKNSGETSKSKENTVKKDAKKTEKPESDKKSGEGSKSKEKKPRDENRKKNERKYSGDLAVNGDKPESSFRNRSSKRVASMGMVFMCSSKTKTDCFKYKILGLPESKKDQVLKIYRGMRLFLFDVDLRLMYGIFKAAGPGGYNIEPKAFKSEFPSQVRFTVLDDCLPLAEENFKSVLKENYYSRNKFEGLLKSDQVKKLCKLFVRGGRSKSAVKSRRARPIETRRSRPDEPRRSRHEDRHSSRAEERRKRRTRDEERRPRSRSRSPPLREKRRYIDYDREPPVLYDREPPVLYDRELPVLYDRELPVSRYHPPPVGSPVRLYNYERPPLDIPPYVREHVPDPHGYRVVNRDLDRERDPYLAYGREPPLYRDAVYTAPPEYHLVSREYHHPPAVQAPEYRVSDETRVPSYRDVEIASDYRSGSGMALPDYRSRTHYNY